MHTRPIWPVWIGSTRTAKSPAREAVGVTPTRAMPLASVSGLSVGVKMDASAPSTRNRPRAAPLPWKKAVESS